MRPLRLISAGIGLLFCLSFHQPILPATWYVDGSVIESGDGTTWQTAFKRAQEGIDAASDGDVVLVAAGVYPEKICFSGKEIELWGWEGPDGTILDGEGTGPVVAFEGAETGGTVMAWVTIRNGSLGILCTESSPTIVECTVCENDGGAVSCSGGSPTFLRCVMSGNRARHAGAGVYVEDCPDVTLRQCVISGNQGGTEGGGIFSRGSNLTLIDCKVLENAGGLLCYTTSLTMQGCEVARNPRGGVWCSNSPSNIDSCGFRGNGWSEWGWGRGAIYFSECESEISNCFFMRNRSEYYGAGANCWRGSVSFANCIFMENAAGSGSAIRFEECSGKITNCTIFENSAADQIAAVECVAASPEICNSILWENGDLDLKLDEASKETLVLHCDIGTAEGAFTDGGGNISSDPFFVDSQNGDFHLLSSSPCRNAGENSHAAPVDMDGEARPVDGIADMGADEFKDNDLDSLPDYWEIKFGLDPEDDGAVNPDNGEAGDPDEDGVSNAEEYLHGTHPRVPPTTLYVSGTSGNDAWNGQAPTHQGGSLGPKRTIASAIESGRGDWLTVRIEEGTYPESVDLVSFLTLEGGWAPGFSKRDVGAHPVELDGERLGSVLICESVRDVTLDGLKVSNGLASNGGGILCSQSSVTLRECSITDNEATWSGGGIHAAAGSSLTLEECRIAENVSAWYGGGATLLEGSSAVFTDCEISANEATEDVALGTGLYCENTDLTLDRCLVSENFGFFAHGTVYCVGCDLLVDACIFTRNTGEWGCAVLCEGSKGRITGCIMRDNDDGVILEDSQLTVSQCTMERNYRGVGIYRGGESVVSDCLLIGNSSGISCTAGTVIRCKMLEGGYGVVCEAGSPVIRDCLVSRNTEAGVKCGSASPTLINCVISGNLGKEYNRGGICCHDSSFPKLINCTVWGNRGNGKGGGILCEYSGFTAANCIFWENSPNDVETANEDYSAILSHCAMGTLVGDYTDVGGNIRDDPKLLRPWRGGFHLRPDSPCIDAGTDVESPRTDFYGEPRPFGAAVDIGADEFVDSDGDSLPDYWEIKFGLNSSDDGTVNPDNGGAGDPDNDSVSNVEELLRGTGPMAGPTTLYVSAEAGNDDWDGRSPVYLGGNTGPKASLTAAISSLGGDVGTVCVSAGTYNGHLELSSWTTISGGWSPWFAFRAPANFETVIRGTGEGSVLSCVGVEEVTLDGLTITGGSAREGGGLRGIDCALRITDCRVESNHAEVRGGGMSITGTSEVSIFGSRIMGNRAGYAGGIHLLGTQGEIRACQVEANTAENGSGGGLHLYNFLGEVTDCEFCGNEARSRGGGMVCSECSPRITNCSFRENSADGGGGVYTVHSEATFSFCRMVGNSAEGGGGISCLGISPTFINCDVSGNTAEYGGGIYAFVCNPRLEKCRIFGNQADSGGGIRLDLDHWLGIPVLINCLIFSNSAPEASALYAYDCDVVMVNCTVFCDTEETVMVFDAQYPHYHTGSIINTIVWGESETHAAIDNRIPQLTISHSLVSSIDGEYQDAGGNISGEPLFVSPATGDFHLLPDSPCIDVGLSDPSVTPSTDMDGEFRPFGEGVDIGADECVDQDFDDLPDYWEIASFAHLWFTEQDDVDEDGLANGQELVSLTDPLNPDTDSDGRNDGHEVAASTDPLDASSFFVILGIELIPHGSRIEFSSVPGRTYLLLVSENLTEWDPLGDPFVADETISCVTDLTPPPNLRFYNVQVQPEP